MATAVRGEFGPEPDSWDTMEGGNSETDRLTVAAPITQMHRAPRGGLQVVHNDLESVRETVRQVYLTTEAQRELPISGSTDWAANQVSLVADRPRYSLVGAALICDCRPVCVVLSAPLTDRMWQHP